MNGEEFQNLVIDKLIKIENRVTKLESKINGSVVIIINNDTIKRAGLVVLTALAAKIGIDLSGFW
ncbi:hypothetical protein [Archaeoglobus veneficus]|uniref:Uncharacterized protein n=1 Tax=Archaeoglobus veneficus (strain DSM 11195 / SNP6) TaxID=693661 RepID=F2KR57_ARCVS|nr:hypothetical protein [Archaeoglobus veneficus]AEA46694.1 hypothetical protein Arcve_0674 [Archaeoglobus veneficus SNP6]